MRRFRIRLNNFDKVKDFIRATERMDCKLELTSGDTIVNGTSILGIFSLDLSKVIEVRAFTESSHEAGDYTSELEPFLI